MPLSQKIRYGLIGWQSKGYVFPFTFSFAVCSYLRPLSPPNTALAAPWFMYRPPHRKAGSSGFPLTGSTKPSTTVSAPCMTALTNALFTWEEPGKSHGEKRRKWTNETYERKLLISVGPGPSCCCLELDHSFHGYLEQCSVSLQPLLQTAVRKTSGCLQLFIPVWGLHVNHTQLYT